ncbi:MAG: HAMP domain-containing protein [Oscillospiraceae bacterium]|nr:HAMP domain-containing protein [Oscillospiraceae bacterium]
MKRTVSLRLRITLVCAALLTLCCLLLTLINNLSAIQMADTIQAAIVLPAQSIGENEIPVSPATETVEPAYQAKRIFHVQSLLAMTAILAIGLFLIDHWVKKSLASLNELTSQIKARTAENLDHLLSVPDSSSEVSELAKAFNQMSQRLNQAFVMQKNFSQNAAHEFRTPLAVMKTRIGLFRKKNGLQAPQTEELLQIMEGEVNRLSTMVSSLLELTNLEREDSFEPLHIEELLQAVADEVSPLAQERRVSITVNASFSVLRGNRQLLHRALFNLMENAVKYSEAGGKVVVAVRCENRWVRVDVTDQGPGIPEELRQQIFEPFFRVDKARSRQLGGAGLGLALVRAIAEYHGGAVIVEAAEAGGSRFVLTLPCDPRLEGTEA